MVWLILVRAHGFDFVLDVAATLLARLRDGEARFELLEDSAAAAAASPAPAPVWPGLSCFSRVATSLYVRLVSLSPPLLIFVSR